jgi:chitodextrinase
MNLRNGLLLLLTSLCTAWATGQEIHTDANAASLVNEADAITGWIGNGAQLANLFSDNTDAIQGDFSLRVESTTANGRYVAYSFAAEVGTVYTIRIWARRGVQVFDPPGPAFASWRGFDGFVNTPILNDTWTEYIFNLRATTTTPQVRVYTGNSFSSESAGNTVFVDGLSITPAETEAPTAITDLTASNITETGVTLSWSPSSDNIGVTNYEIFQDGVSIGNAGTATSFDVTGLIPGSNYQFAVIAQDEALNDSEVSNIVPVLTLSDVIPPSAITDLAVDTSGNGVILFWTEATDNVGVVNYEIFQDGVSIGNAGTNLSFTVTGLLPLTDYTFTVVAQDAAGNDSAASNAVLVNLINDNIAPDAITDLSASNTTGSGTTLS